jgi:NitT/TauT family transport system ATP-binding protein
MDEAFSALDVLTGERLREEILELWQSGQIPTKAILVVSHNIEEAVMMADRVLIFASDPGRVRAELPISLAQPRKAESAEVRQLIDKVYELMTASSGRRGSGGGLISEREVKLQLGDRLPQADIAHMEGILELLAEETELTDAELLEVLNALLLLGFAYLTNGDILLTELGGRYVKSEERQEMFGKQLLEHVPLIAYICHGLEQDKSGDLPEDLFLKLLRFTLSEEEAERALRMAIEWGRYGDLFEYNFNTGVIQRSEEDEQEAD